MMNYQIVEKDAFQVVGIKKECPYDDDSGVVGIPELWREVNANGTADKLVQLMNGEIKGLLGVTDKYNAETKTIDYWVAAEHVGDVPLDLNSLEIPPSKWVVFEVNGSAPVAMPEAWRQIYSEWIPTTSFEVADIPAIEACTDANPYRPDAVNKIWLAIK